MGNVPGLQTEGGFRPLRSQALGLPHRVDGGYFAPLKSGSAHRPRQATSRCAPFWRPSRARLNVRFMFV